MANNDTGFGWAALIGGVGLFGGLMWLNAKRERAVAAKTESSGTGDTGDTGLPRDTGVPIAPGTLAPGGPSFEPLMGIEERWLRTMEYRGNAIATTARRVRETYDRESLVGVEKYIEALANEGLPRMYSILDGPHGPIPVDMPRLVRPKRPKTAGVRQGLRYTLNSSGTRSA